MTRRLLAILLLLATPCLPACSELSDLWRLRGELAERYGEVSVHLSVENGERELRIGLEDAALQDLSPEEQVARAIDVGRFADSHYARSERVDVYDVRFVAKSGGVSLFETERYRSFRMTPQELRQSE